ncbi:MAG TPA: class I SAM-dependent methyltransferase [Trebonia sp.]|jgi:predicted O-methyltransferase YrrM|nr:class I SAM-dependent methyltransferase [Trebonia sp.]
MTTLTTAPLAALLDRLFTEADAPASPRVRDALARFAPEERRRLSASTDAAEYRAFYGLAKDEYLAVSRETATLLYLLVRSSGARSIVEFGTSFGISTLHLAAGLRDNELADSELGGNHGGRVIATEFEPSKAARAQENFAAGGLADLIELRAGDALSTLAHDLPGQIDLVLLDGAKGLYPAVLALLEERLRPGALIVADNADRSPEYLRRVRSAAAGYVSVPFAADVELSMRTAG